MRESNLRHFSTAVRSVRWFRDKVGRFDTMQLKVLPIQASSWFDNDCLLKAQFYWTLIFKLYKLDRGVAINRNMQLTSTAMTCKMNSTASQGGKIWIMSGCIESIDFMLVSKKIRFVLKRFPYLLPFYHLSSFLQQVNKDTVQPSWSHESLTTCVFSCFQCLPFFVYHAYAQVLRRPYKA